MSRRDGYTSNAEATASAVASRLRRRQNEYHCIRYMRWYF